MPDTLWASSFFHQGNYLTRGSVLTVNITYSITFSFCFLAVIMKLAYSVPAEWVFSLWQIEIKKLRSEHSEARPCSNRPACSQNKNDSLQAKWEALKKNWGLRIINTVFYKYFTGLLLSFSPLSMRTICSEWTVLVAGRLSFLKLHFRRGLCKNG